MGKSIKTFTDLEFKDHPRWPGCTIARIDFDHGHFISVIGGLPGPQYGHGKTTYEVYSGHHNGRKTCKGYRSRRQITERMRYLQSLEGK